MKSPLSEFFNRKEEPLENQVQLVAEVQGIEVMNAVFKYKKESYIAVQNAIEWLPPTNVSLFNVSKSVFGVTVSLGSFPGRTPKDAVIKCIEERIKRGMN